MLLSIDAYTITHNMGMHDVFMRRVGLHKNANLPQQEKKKFTNSHFRNQAKFFSDVVLLDCFMHIGI
jgi:hypothetical protein